MINTLLIKLQLLQEDCVVPWVIFFSFFEQASSSILCWGSRGPLGSHLIL